jgi:hypothetical protein
MKAKPCLGLRHPGVFITGLTPICLTSCLDYPPTVQTNPAGRTQQWPRIAFNSKVGWNSRLLFSSGNPELTPAKVEGLACIVFKQPIAKRISMLFQAAANELIAKG